jgi:hypothetical protein
MGQNVAQFSAGSAAVIATLVAVHGLAGPSQAETFDTRWTAVEPLQKGDRLGTPANSAASSIVFFNDPASAMTIATKVPGARTESAPPPSNNRQVPNENARQDKPKKLLVGCDPSFSPVTTPSMANVTGRCLAALDHPSKVAELAR